MASVFFNTIFDENSEKSKRKISSIINEIGQLTDIEKLLLYLQLPSGSPYDIDPLKQKGPGNPFGKKADAEVAQTYTWIQSHLEEDPSTSLPKHEVYEEYRGFCQANKFEPLCVADFGKAMKQIFPRVKPRRLGQRGNSKYCYSGLKKKLVVEPPSLPDLDVFKSENDEKCDTSCNVKESDLHDKGTFSEDTVFAAANHVVIEWAEKLLSQQFKTIKDLGRYLIDTEYVDNTSVAALTMISSVDVKQQNKMILKKSMNRAGKRDAQIHLQKKLHQKELLNEQKKKLELNRATSITKSVSVSSNKQISSKKTKKNAVGSESTRFVLKHPLEEIKVKVEKEDHFSDQKSCVETIVPNQGIHNKVPIPRSGAPHLSSNHLSAASFIVLPSIPPGVRLSSGTPKQVSEANSTQTVSVIPTSPMKSASKYKRIQPKPPKPTPVHRSNSVIESVISSSASNSSLDSNDNFDSNIKRRHSVSVPITAENKHIQLETVNSEKQIKRHMEEKDNSTVPKKRLVDISKEITYLPPTNSSEEILSSASLSPVSQPELNCVTKADCGRQGLVVQDLEQDCLLEYFPESTATANECWESSPEKLSQLRKILEEKLPQSASKNGDQKQQLQGFSELRQALLKKSVPNFRQVGNHFNDSTDSSETQSISNNYCTSHNTTTLTSPLEPYMCTNFNGSSLHDINSLSSSGVAVVANVISTNVQTQFPSVPPSPNARRRAFSFQPISPRNTPTIPENSSVSSSAYGSLSASSGYSPPQYNSNQHSVGVGPSLSPSAANSPFVSPRSTPIPLSRSRHNSGQSTYSASRQTPFQNFDSGVSSVSNSPFISPQSTPVPISRVRVGSNGMQMRTLRARHSSGPGNPYTSLHHTFPSAVGPRSCSLSPMVCTTTEVTPSSQMISNLVLAEKEKVNAIAGGLSATNGVATSPMSDSLSPITNNAPAENQMFCVENNEAPSAVKKERQRHMSNPYTASPSTPVTCSTDSQEIQHLLKNFDLSDQHSTKKALLNRSHSVPVHQMKLRGCIRGNSNSPPTSKTGNGHTGMRCNVFEESTFASKSYPATPICSQSFQFPPSPPSSTKLQSVIGNEDTCNSFLQSGHDVMVSGLQPSRISRTLTVSNEIIADNDLMNTNIPLMNASEPRRNLNDLLTAPPAMEDVLQTTLEDLRDCDSEFSKFAQELEAMEANDDLS